MSVDYDRAVTSVWSAYGHRFMSTGEQADDAGLQTYEDCLTCGAQFILRNLGDGQGEYITNGGDQPIECSGRTDIVHGYERVCQADYGRGCQESEEGGDCEHTDHECNCVQCD
jgi:hypothetical protein